LRSKRVPSFDKKNLRSKAQPKFSSDRKDQESSSSSAVLTSFKPTPSRRRKGVFDTGMEASSDNDDEGSEASSDDVNGGDDESGASSDDDDESGSNRVDDDGDGASDDADDAAGASSVDDDESGARAGDVDRNESGASSVDDDAEGEVVGDKGRDAKKIEQKGSSTGVSSGGNGNEIEREVTRPAACLSKESESLKVVGRLDFQPGIEPGSTRSGKNFRKFFSKTAHAGSRTLDPLPKIDATLVSDDFFLTENSFLPEDDITDDGNVLWENHSEDESFLNERFLELSSLPGHQDPLSARNKRALQATVKRMCQQYLQHPTTYNLLLILAIPKVAMAPASVAKNPRVLQRRLKMYPQGMDFNHVMSTVRKKRHSAVATRPQRGITNAVLRKVELDVKQGRLKRAAARLTNKLGIAPANLETAQKLEALHPKANPPRIPRGVSGRTSLHVPPEQVSTTIRRMDKETAGGISGWTAALTLACTRVPAFRTFLNLITKQIAHGTAPGRNMLTSSKLVPLVKNTKGGIRPIAVGEIFYRIAASAISRACRTKDDLLDTQFGVGTKGGVEPVIWLQEQALRPAVEAAGRVVIQLDLENAFNKLSRSTIAIAIADRNPQLMKFFKWSYGQHSPLVLPADNGGDPFVLSSEEGVRQGDPMGPYLFSLAYRDTLLELEDKLDHSLGQDEKGRRCTAYLDDTSVRVKPEQVDEAIDIIDNVFDDEAVSRGFVLVVEKGRVDYPGDDKAGAIPLLGSCIGTAAARSAFLRAKHVELMDLMEPLTRMNKQAGLLLASKCFVPKLAHLMRCMDPAGVEDQWQELDVTMRTFVYTIMNNGDDPNEEQQAVDSTLMALPLRMGGLGGFGSYSMTLYEARAASIDSSHATLAAMWDSETLDSMLNMVPDVDDEEYGKSQRDRMSSKWQGELDLLLASLPPQQAITVLENGSSVGAAWMRTLPLYRHLTLSDHDIVTGLHLRTLRPGRAEVGACTYCGLPNPLLGHEQQCGPLSRMHSIRHDALKIMTRDLYQGTGKCTFLELEPSSKNVTDKRRTDLLVAGAVAPIADRACIDFTVVSFASSKSRAIIERQAREWPVGESVDNGAGTGDEGSNTSEVGADGDNVAGGENVGSIVGSTAGEEDASDEETDEEAGVGDDTGGGTMESQAGSIAGEGSGDEESDTSSTSPEQNIRRYVRETAFAALEKRVLDKRNHYKTSSLKGEFVPFVISAGGLFHRDANKALRIIVAAGAGDLVKAFTHRLSVMLLRSRATVFRS
jgi:hypothetical protein